MVNITDELEAYPVLVGLRERLGLTLAWRRELAGRAVALPGFGQPHR